MIANETHFLGPINPRLVRDKKARKRYERELGKQVLEWLSNADVLAVIPYRIDENE